jgi:hypothetical protein
VLPIQVVKAFYEALAKSEIPAVLALLAPDVEWTEAERFPYYGGTWRSPQQVVDNLLVPLARDWDGFSARAHEFITEADRVVSLGTYAGRLKASGRSISVPFAHIWTVRGGRIAKFDMYVDTAKVLDAFRSAPVDDQKRSQLRTQLPAPRDAEVEAPVTARPHRRGE